MIGSVRWNEVPVDIQNELLIVPIVRFSSDGGLDHSGLGACLHDAVNNDLVLSVLHGTYCPDMLREKGKQKPNILDAPWQLKVDKVLCSVFVAIGLILLVEFTLHCGMAAAVLGGMLFVVFWSRCILPFCVLGVWCLHLIDLRTVPFLDFEPAWNNIPMFDHAEYGNIEMSSGAYMSICFPNVCPGFNGAYLYGVLFMCAVLMYVLRNSATPTR